MRCECHVPFRHAVKTETQSAPGDGGDALFIRFLVITSDGMGLDYKRYLATFCLEVGAECGFAGVSAA